MQLPTKAPTSRLLPLNSFPADGCKVRKSWWRTPTISSVLSSQPTKVSDFNCHVTESRGALEALKKTVGIISEQGSSVFGLSCNREVKCSNRLDNFDEDVNLGCNGDADSASKQKLGSKWREYQGCNDWEGLLDPLDENLRHEIIKYGEFVRATYSAFDFDQRSKTYGLCKYSKSSLPREAGIGSCGYSVTQHLHATSGVQVPGWLKAMLSSSSTVDATRVARQTSWMGFVAVCEDEREIARLGRRDIVVAYRGTATPLEWVENFRDIPWPVADTSAGSDVDDGRPQPKVQSGFWSLYTCKDSSGRSASTYLMEEIRRLVDLYRGEEVSITITGHSLGAAVALLSAYQLGGVFQGSGIPVTVISFGGPRVGNRELGRRMEDMGVKVLRIVNTQDVITKVPGLGLNEWMQYRLMKKQQSSEKARRVARVLENLYWHVGTEFRVNSKHSPYLRDEADISCCHDLEAYLHLIDGFLSSNVPFRCTAKRYLLRWLVKQKSNIIRTRRERIL